MDPRFQHLKYFVALADERSFTRAANRVGITQPSFSEAIRELESSLQLSLFTRTSRFVEVSDDGATLLQAARDAVLAIEQFRHQAIELRRLSDDAQLQIGAPLYSACPSLEFEILEGFNKSFPSSSAMMTRRTVVDLINLLQTGAIDLAVVLGPCARSDLSFIKIARIPFHITVHTNSPYAKLGMVPLSALQGLHVAGFERRHSPGTFDALMAPLESAGLVIDNVLENSIMGMRRHCEARQCAMVVPEEMIPMVTADEQFVCVPVSDIELSIDMKLARTNKPQKRGAQRFWDYVAAAYTNSKAVPKTINR